MTDRVDRLREHYEGADTSDGLAKATPERPDTAAEPMVTYALRLPKPVLDELRAAAGRRGKPVSALMRDWLEERLGSESGGQEKVVSVDEILAFVAERAHPAG